MRKDSATNHVCNTLYDEMPDFEEHLATSDANSPYTSFRNQMYAMSREGPAVLSETRPASSGSFTFAQRPVQHFHETSAFRLPEHRNYGASAYEPQPFRSAQQEISTSGPPMLVSSFPDTKFVIKSLFSTNCTEPVLLLPATLPQFERSGSEEYQSSICQTVNRKYMNWINTVYYSTQSPIAFVQAWREALKEMRQAFGRPHLPTIFVLNQFLAAVSVNPNLITWVNSLEYKTGSLPASILDEAYADFLEFEAQRLGRADFNVANLKGTKMEVLQYCPFHKHPTKHSVEACFLNPENTKRKRKWRRHQGQAASATAAWMG